MQRELTPAATRSAGASFLKRVLWFFYVVAIGLFLAFAWSQFGQYSFPKVVQPDRSQYVQVARQAALDSGIDPDLFVRQIAQESNFNPNAVSRAGAIGIAQFMPTTAAGLHINPWDPQAALSGAARLMASYLSLFGGRWDLALGAYNSGQERTRSCLTTSNWWGCLPAETRGYILKIYGKR